MSIGLAAGALATGLGASAGVAGIASAVAPSLIGGLMGSDSAGDAYGSQAAGAGQANATLQANYDQTRNDLSKWMTGGQTSNDKLQYLLGSGGTDVAGRTYGELLKSFDQNDLDNDVVYKTGLQFGLDEGTKGINNIAAATGSQLSGATLKALSRFGNNYATTKAGGAYDRFMADKNQRYNFLSGNSQQGQQAAGTISSAGQAMANGVAANQTGLGNARGASEIAGSNSLIGGLTGAYDAYQGNKLLGSLTGGGRSMSGGYNVGAEPYPGYNASVGL